MRINFNTTIALMAFVTTFGACKKDKETSTKTTGPYILAVTPVASQGVADYLINVPNLDNGSVTTKGNGVEQDGTYRYYVTANNKFFSMLYGQGNPGAVTTYSNTNGSLSKLSNFQTETVQAFAPVKDDILLVKVPRSINADGETLASYFQVSTNSLTIAKSGTINTKLPPDNGEIAHYSWLTQVGDKVWAPFFSIYNSSFWTKYPDQAWIAVYSYPDMALEKVIKDDRTSFIGRYFVNGLAPTENGDIYAFSTGVAQDDNTATTDNLKDAKLTSTKPAAITRIKANTTEFDQSYYFNIEAASNNYVLTDWLYLGNNTVVANVMPKEKKGAYTVGTELAVINLVNKTFTLVKGLPSTGEVKSLMGRNNYTPKDGKTAYFGVNLVNGESYVYKVDASTATATKGLKVEGGPITAIHYLQ